jgi:tRNA-binding EMAP/Myf-like protein
LIHWRVDIMGDDIAQGVELRFSLYGEQFKGGDGLYFVNLDSVRSEGMVISAEETDAVISKGQGKWRIARKSPNIWDVAERVR